MSGKESSGSEAESDAAVRLVLVAAIVDSRVTSRDGDVSWHLSEDLKQFKRATTGHPVVMGRETYESIARQLGDPLPERHSVVLTTRDLDFPEGAGAAESVESAVAATEDMADEMGIETVYVIGGAAVYEQFLGRAAELVLIEPDAAHEDDTRFPEWDREKWVETDRSDCGSSSFVTYKRKQPAVADHGAEESDG